MQHLNCYVNPWKNIIVKASFTHLKWFKITYRWLINTVSNRKAAKSVSTYDFSGLYTNISYDKVLKTLNFVKDFAFEGKIQNKIPISNYGIVYWCEFSKYFVFHNHLKKAVEYLIRNCYFITPVASDPPPFFNNFILFCFEWQYINKLILDQTFCHICTVIDFLITINKKNFQANIWNIYRAQLELKKEKQVNKNSNFLVLNIHKENSRFQMRCLQKYFEYGK